MKNKSLILAIFLILVVFLSSSAVFAEDSSDIQAANGDELELQQNNIDDVKASSTYTIKSGSTSDEIQSTINSMSDGDVLNFEEGDYADVCIYINKSITVNGNGANLIGYDNPSASNVPSIITNKTANGGYGIGNIATLYIVRADNVNINGLTITGGANSGSETAGPAYSNALVYVTYSNNLIFKDNVVDGSSWGIYLQYSHDCQIVENTIKNQAVTGLLNFGSARTLIDRNTVINAKNHGIDVRHGTGPNVQVTNNNISGSKEGIYLMHSKGHTAANNIIENCSISSISCYGSSNIEIENNIMKKSRIGILLGGGYNNLSVGTNTWSLDNLPFPPTFVYYIAEAKTDSASADKMIGTHSDSSSYSPTYVEYKGIATPNEIKIKYKTLLKTTGTLWKVPKKATSADIQAIIDAMADGDTLQFAKNAVYKNISIYTDKNIKIKGNNATLIGYNNLDLANCPSKITATTANDGYAIGERAVLYVVNNTGAVVSNLNIVSQYPGYDPNTVVTPNTNEYKTAGIRTKNAVNVAITGCTIDGASWGIYMEYSTKAIVTNNNIKNQFTTGILNFGTGNSIIANNTITDAVNHGIDVRHGTGPKVTVFNNTISGSKEGIYLMHSQGHTVYNNTIINGVLSGITCYGSGNEKIFNNTISGSRLGILLGGNYYNVTIGPNTYDLDFLPFPPTFVSYLVKAEQKYYQAADGKTYSDKNAVDLEARTLVTKAGKIQYNATLTDADGNGIKLQIIKLSVNNKTYKAKTDENGIATFSFKLSKGEYPVTVEYDGTDNYKPASKTPTIIIAAAVKPANNTAAGIQAAVDAAKEGEIVDLTVFDDYDVENATIEVGTKNITILGDGATVIKGWGGPGNGIFHISANDVTFKGIEFVDTNPNSVLTYVDDATKGTNEVKGWGIHFQKASNGLVDNCSFINFNHGVRIQQQSNDVTVQNCYFTGVTNYLRNDPTVNVEKGTKAIGVMGSQRPTIKNNVFDGPVLDAISLASGCGGALVENNTFNGNSYAIYFGGASTAGTYIRNNRFINCGAYNGTDDKGATVTWNKLPVISIQKAAAGLEITDNEFQAIDDNVLIAAEAGNTAHGYPSEIGNINVTGNTVNKYTPDTIAQSVTLLHILSRGGDLNPTGPIDVTGNTLEGAVKAVVYWNTAWGAEDGQISAAYIPKGTLASTSIVITNIANKGTVTAVLKDLNGKEIAGELITYTAGDVNGTVETDEEGSFSIDAPLGTPIEIIFAGTNKLAGSSINITVPAPAEQIETIVEAEANVGRYANDYYAGERGALVTGVLKDANGNPLANKTCYVAINGAIYEYNTDHKEKTTITDENGIFGVSVNMDTANVYTYALIFLGDDDYKASFNCTRLTLNKKPVTLTAPAKTFSASASTKQIAVTMKTIKNPYDGKTYLSGGKQITLNLNGVTYTAKTNSNGVATFNVKLTTRGTYTASISFAGDKTYNTASTTTTVKIT